MAEKIVRYNGGRDYHYPCMNPNILVKGERYFVQQEIDHGFQTNVILRGIDGEFNKLWFDEVKTYMAFSKVTPSEGHKMQFTVMQEKDGTVTAQNITTSVVKRSTRLMGNTFLVETKNALYVVQCTLI